MRGRSHGRGCLEVELVEHFGPSAIEGPSLSKILHLLAPFRLYSHRIKLPLRLCSDAVCECAC
jgi:hypothetical protein